MKNIDPIEFHKNLLGKITIKSKVHLDEKTLPVAYTPGVGAVSKAIAEDVSRLDDLTGKYTKVAIVTDGSAVLGLGNIGPCAALPVMEGKAAIFSQFADVYAVPICLYTQDTEEIIQTIKNISCSFGGINLEDISAPRCFEIERRLTEEIDIPVFHDDQHGTAIVILAALINALKVVGKDKSVKIIISGAGAAGIATANLLADYGFTNYCLCDSHGVIGEERDKRTNEFKKEAVSESSASCPLGPCKEVLGGTDVLIGVSQPNQFTADDIKKMNDNPIVFALANPVPEIMPDEAKNGGAAVVATGRSDFPNQVNNALVFPGLFKGLLQDRIQHVSTEMKLAIAETIASLIESPTPENIIPSIFDERVVSAIAETVRKHK